MFCEKCGREIPEDSVFCAYCGVTIPPEARELDWEEAARLREMAERSPAAQPSARHAARGYDPGCVTPGAPKKKCVECGRELPSSTVSDRCALCEIRENRKREERERRVQEARFEREIAEGKRDRYDVSDEFDWRVFQSQPAAPVPPKEPGGWESGPKAQKPKRRKNMSVVILTVIVAVFLLPTLFQMAGALIGGFAYGFGQRSPEPEALIQQEEALTEDSSIGSGQMEGAGESEDTFELWVRPMLDWALESNLPPDLVYEGFDEGSTVWWADGVINYVFGDMTVTDADGETVYMTFETAFVVTGDVPGGTGYVLRMVLDGEALYDDLALVDNQGRVTEEGAIAFGQEPGEYPYGEIPRDLDSEA